MVCSISRIMAHYPGQGELGLQVRFCQDVTASEVAPKHPACSWRSWYE